MRGGGEGKGREGEGGIEAAADSVRSKGRPERQA
jgi:hypothetical protein